MAAHRTGTEAAIIRGGLRWLMEELGEFSASRNINGYITRISDSLARIDTFVQEFTQFTKPPHLQLERLNINELCKEALSSFTSGNLDKIKFDPQLACDLPQFWGDREKLLYAFKEILHNALKATTKKGGCLTVISESIKDGASIRIVFKDSGSGIPNNVKEKIFEPGFKNRPGGTGLGLAIVQTTIRLHKGKILEDGKSGDGARFVIELPVRMPKGAKETVLVVDDTEPVRHDLEKIVKWDAPDRQVFTASNEKDAIRFLEQSSFDVIVTDINLEEAGGTATGGLDVLKAVLAKDTITPVIVVTAYGKMGIHAEGNSKNEIVTVEEMANRLKCFAFIPRPHPTRDYLDVVREFVTQALQARTNRVKTS